MEEAYHMDRDNESGSIGIGAMIVFIALILVAAVASTIIIKTAEELQQNAENTSDDTRKQISGKVSIVDVFVKTAADPLTVGSGNTDVATMEVIARISSGSIGVADGDIEYSISCKVTYTAGGTTFAVVDSGTADLKGVGDTTGIADEDMLPSGTYVIATLGTTTWDDIDTNGDTNGGAKDLADYSVGDEITVVDGWDQATGIGTGTANDDAFFSGEELTAGTVFKFEIDLADSNADDSDNTIDADDFALREGDADPGCDAEAGTGEELDMRIVVDGGGETLATLKIDSLTLGSSMM